MDVCHLAVTAYLTVPAIGCITEPVCRPELSGQRTLCDPGVCQFQMPPRVYECTRPDGAKYTYSVPNTGSIPAGGQ